MLSFALSMLFSVGWGFFCSWMWEFPQDTMLSIIGAIIITTFFIFIHERYNF